MIHADDSKKISTDLLYEDLTYKVRGAIFTVYNELGFGHKESIYHKALIQEFTSLQIPYEEEHGLSVRYKGVHVGNYRPDFVVDRKLILEIKAVELMPKIFETQLINYLKTTDFELGLLVNFGSQKLYIKRLVWTKHQPTNQ